MQSYGADDFRSRFLCFKQPIKPFVFCAKALPAKRSERAMTIGFIFTSDCVKSENFKPIAKRGN